MTKQSSSVPETIADSIAKAFGSLTRTERQLANSINENYPVSGLGSITQVAEKAGVSSPTIVRMVKKTGIQRLPRIPGRTTAGTGSQDSRAYYQIRQLGAEGTG
jgi:hypothetical protein